MAGASPSGATAEASASDEDARNWIGEIEAAEKDMERFVKRAKKIRKLYAKEETKTVGDREFAMLWANIEVLKPVCYSRQPKPVVSRRFNDQDAVGRQVSELLQRALISTFERSNIDLCLKSVRDDFLLVARGTAWVRYNPRFETQTIGEEEIEALADETLGYDFVHWADFLHPKGRRWEELPWVGRRVYLDRATFQKRFGADKDGKPLAKEEADRLWAAVSGTDPASGAYGANRADRDTPKGMVAIYEIWSRRDDQIVWVAKTYPKFLDRQPPLYRLHGFFPCPRPAFGTLQTDSLTPTPDYVYYQDQAEEIDDLTGRIAALQDSLKLVGFYPAGAEGEISTAIETALSPATKNKMIPVPAWAAFTAGGGSKELIQWLPIDVVLEVLKGCIETRKQLVEDVYQIIGIADIMRGASDPSETATAQNFKAQWGSIRVRVRQGELARFARDLTVISAEIMAEKFQPETLWRMTGLQFPSNAQKEQAQALVQQHQQMAAAQAQSAQGTAPPGPPGAPGPQPAPPQPQTAPAGPPGVPGAPPAGGAPPGPADIPPEIQRLLNSPSQEDIIQLLHDDQLRSYRVDIETDSTIEADEQADQQRRTEFITAVGGFIQQALPVVSQVPELMPMVGEMLLFLVRGFAAGRQLEDVIESAVSQIEEKAKIALSQPPQPDPALAIEQAKQQTEQADIAAKQQTEAARIAAEQQKTQVDADTEATKAAADHARAQAEFDAKQAQAVRELDLKARAHDLDERKHGLAVDQHHFTVARAAKQDQLAVAQHNRQLIDESAAEGAPEDGEAPQSAMQTLLSTIGQLAATIAQGQQQITIQVAESQRELVGALTTEQREARAEQREEGQRIAALLAAVTAPKRIVRGPDGRAAGVETVTH